MRSGKIPESVVDEAVRRILRVKFALGLFEHPYIEAGPAYEPTPEKRALTRKVADETLVLLKNDPVEGVGALLPMTGKTKKVALIGPMADNPRDILGAWTGGDPEIRHHPAQGAERTPGRQAAVRRRLRAALRRRTRSP